jgi:hypothetical protein
MVEERHVISKQIHGNTLANELDASLQGDR